MSLFVTFEGLEGSGKSTQARLLYERLQALGYPVILTREPGGTRISEMIRRILTDLQHTEMAPSTEILLFSAARAQLVNELIRPYLDMGGIVLCDRYADSTYAYQGYGLKRQLDELRIITSIATGDTMPDMTFYLDLTAEEGLKRKQLARQQSSKSSKMGESIAAYASSNTPPPAHGQAEWNRLDARDLSYHQRVEAGFRELMLQEPERWCRLDAHLSVEELAHQVLTRIEPFLARVVPLERE
jgi:dTMP kinase